MNRYRCWEPDVPESEVMMIINATCMEDAVIAWTKAVFIGDDFEGDVCVRSLSMPSLPVETFHLTPQIAWKVRRVTNE